MNNGSKRASRNDFALPKGAFAVCTLVKEADCVTIGSVSINCVTIGHKSADRTPADRPNATNIAAATLSSIGHADVSALYHADTFAIVDAAADSAA